MSLKLMALLVTAVSFSAAAQSRYMAILGGGGEPKTEGTIFDTDVNSMTKFATSNPQWNTTLSFNGGHAKTEKIIQDNMGSYNVATQSFTRKSYEAIVKSYEDKINAGEIKPGDQLLLHINTHGATRNAAMEKTHVVSTAEGTLTNYDTLGGDTVSLDRLDKLAKLAEQKGIKLAIIDQSCHSGNTLNLANKNTCVITGTGPNHYGYGGGGSTFNSKFNEKFAKGKNLEEIFLDARSDFYDMSFPMISSPQGQDIQKRIYDGITPYLYNYDPKHDKLTPFLEKEFATGEYCNADTTHNKLIAEVNTLLTVSATAATKDAVDKFKTAANDYYNYLTTLRTDMKNAGFAEMDEQHEFCGDIPKQFQAKLHKTKECMKYSNKQLLTLNFDNIITSFTNSANKAALPHDKASYLAMVDFLQKAKLARAQLIVDHPSYVNIEKFWESYPDRQKKTNDLGFAVARAQQKVYDLLYRSSAATGPNPCKDFVL